MRNWPVFLALSWAIPFFCGSWCEAWQEAPKPILALDSGGHTATVTRVEFTPDERHLITTSFDKTLRIWDFAPNAAAPYPGPGKSISRVVRPPQRETLLNVKFNDGIGSLSIAKDGKRLAIARTRHGARREIDLISYPELRLEGTLQSDFGNIVDIAISPNGKWLAAAGASSTAQKENNLAIWDLSFKQPFKAIRDDHGSVFAIAWHPDAPLLAAACGDGTVRIWDVTVGKVKQNLPPASGAGENFHWTSLSWSQSGKQLAMLGEGKQIVVAVVDPFTGRSIAATDIAGMPSGSSIHFAPNSAQLLLRSSRGAKLVEASTLKLPDAALGILNERFAYEHAAFSPSGRYIALAGGDLNQVLVYEFASGKLVQSMTGTGVAMNRVGWSSDGTQLAFNSHVDPKADISLLELTEESAKALGPVRYDWGFDLANLEFSDVKELAQQKVNRSIFLQPQGKPRSSIFSHELGNLAAVNFGNAFFVLTRDREAEENYKKLPPEIEAQWRVVQFPHEGSSIIDITASHNGAYLATTGADQTIRIYKTGARDRLLSLFFAVDREGGGKNEWIAWSDAGYYACSPGGERLMGWHVQRSPNELAEFLPALRFRKSLYRPDILKLLLQTGSIEKAVAAAAAASGKKATPIKVEEVLPPLAKILSPMVGQAIPADKPFKVRAVAQSAGNRPVTAMRLLVDGRPLGEVVRVAPVNAMNPGDFQQEWEIQLPPGRHQIAVQAESAVSKGVSPPIEINAAAERSLVPMMEPSVEASVDLPSLYVLAIGISDYEGDLKLNYAARDAEVLAKTLQTSSKPIFRKVEVKLLTNKQATRKEILQGMTWLRKQMTQRDVAILMFAGHGSKDSDGNFYLIPADFDSEDLFASAVSGDQVKSSIASLPGRVLVLLDACHAGTVGGDKRRAGGSLADDLVRDLVTDDYGVVVMCSAMGREFAHESDSVEHGYFTLALIEGLSGKGDYNKDGVVHLNELDLYASDRVKALAQGKQHPVTTKPTSIRSFPLSKP